GHFVRTRQLGEVFGAETGFTIARNPDTVRAPDVAFVTSARIAAIGVTKKFFSGAPDLAVEVVSPSDTVNEVDEKVQDWLDACVRLVWVVNPKPRTVIVYARGQSPRILSESESLDGSDVVPGFRLPIRDIFH